MVTAGKARASSGKRYVNCKISERNSDIAGHRVQLSIPKTYVCLLSGCHIPSQLKKKEEDFLLGFFSYLTSGDIWSHSWAESQRADFSSMYRIPCREESLELQPFDRLRHL